ncbi:MAG TPA: DUF4271 domain-containing protein [Agriterribacter sp.]|nr:DUF4271 domain-containing protein [Agriterribacter sp.]
MRRILVLWAIMQMVTVVSVHGQEDSSARGLPGVPPSVANDSVAGTLKKEPLVNVPREDSPIVRKKTNRDTVPSISGSRKIVPDNKAALVDMQDSVEVAPVHFLPSRFTPNEGRRSVYIEKHPYYGMGKDIIFMPSKWYEPKSKDELFYVFCSILFFLGILKLGFPKYFQDIFNVFWRSAVRQKQMRDQIQQAGMTTVLFNTFFVFSTALFGYLAINYTSDYSLRPWLLFSICVLGITFIYSGKYFVLKLTGWMFGQQELADSYIFIVFLVNKILAILLMPFMLALAFGDAALQKVAFTISLALLLALLIYRFVLSFAGFRNELRISIFHLFLYVCGFEIIPVLVIYKLLLQFFTRSS